MTESKLFAEILLLQKVGKDKDTLTYAVPLELNPKLGQIVEIPLRNNKTKGMVYKIHSKKPPYATKPVIKIVPNAPHLSDWQINLIEWISTYYFCPKFRVLKLFLPTSITKKKKINDWQPFIANPLELKFKHKLSTDQEKILAKLKSSKNNIALLHGITGSGKTEVYMHIVEDALKKGQQVLILIPEISLSPQMCQRFQDHFHEHTVSIHSQLTVKQKEDAWLSIYSGKAKIVIGSRSAIFAPFQNLGHIIIDEEHDQCYKQDQAPRYNAIDVAVKIAELLNIKVLMGSATPSLESYFKAKSGVYDLLELSNRPTSPNSKLPQTKIIDLREEMKKKNFSIFSELLQDQINQKLDSNEQTLLFLNRRGAASAVICRSCGYVSKCGSCDTTLTYHKKVTFEDSIYNTERLICHHCGRMEKVPLKCPRCESAYIKYIGIGTQRVEEDLKKIFPLARILRADKDTTRKRDQFRHIYEAFKNGRADILIGTQMVAIGLHLPKINLVGVILADLGLTIPDFRSAERTFQLLTQVSGRAGRSEKAGNVIIQSYLPNHYAIQAAAAHDYHGFYEKEINMRKELSYPPFNNLIKLTIKDRNEKKCHTQAQKLYEELEKINLNHLVRITIYPALLAKLRGYYRWHLLISGQNPQKILKKLSNIDNIIIDVDPQSII